MRLTWIDYDGGLPKLYLEVFRDVHCKVLLLTPSQLGVLEGPKTLDSELHDTSPPDPSPFAALRTLSTFEFVRLISEPISLQKHIHEYVMTPYSLMSAAACGMTTADVLFGLYVALGGKVCSENVVEFMLLLKLLTVNDCGRSEVVPCSRTTNKSPAQRKKKKSNSKSSQNEMERGEQPREFEEINNSLPRDHSISIISFFKELAPTGVISYIMNIYEKYNKMSIVLGSLKGTTQNTSPYFHKSKSAYSLELQKTSDGVNLLAKSMAPSLSKNERPIAQGSLASPDKIHIDEQGGGTLECSDSKAKPTSESFSSEQPHFQNSSFNADYVLEMEAPESISEMLQSRFDLVPVERGSPSSVSTVEKTFIHFENQDLKEKPSFRSAKRNFVIPMRNLKSLKTYLIDTCGYSVMQEYDFRKENDFSLPPLSISLASSVFLRPYQREALSHFVINGQRAVSGIIVLPCGAGKTLLGISALCTVGRPAVVVCPSAVSVEQWKRQFLEFTTSRNTNDPSVKTQVLSLLSRGKQSITNSTSIILTTYSMLCVDPARRSEKSRRMIDRLTSRPWGTLILDEVHSLPANIFQRIMSQVHARCVLGLTATLLREDDKVQNLTHLVGPKLYEVSRNYLVQQNYLAQVSCVQLTCTMTPPFLKEYSRPGSPMPLRLCLAASNPQKIRECVHLCQKHTRNGDKVMVFSDSLFALHICREALRCPILTGKTPHHERLAILSDFQHSLSCSVLCISRVGDTSINLPAASVLVQISFQGGSRRQEVQRIGRLLRPKPSGGSTYFYSLISSHTHEISFAHRRRSYLEQQGYQILSKRSFLDPSLQSSYGITLPMSSNEGVLDVLGRAISQWESVFHDDMLEQRTLLDDTLIPSIANGGSKENTWKRSRNAVESPPFSANDWIEHREEGIVMRHGSLADLSVGENDLVFSEYTLLDEKVVS